MSIIKVRKSNARIQFVNPLTLKVENHRFCDDCGRKKVKTIDMDDEV